MADTDNVYDLARSAVPSSEKFNTTIYCQKCFQIGSVFWEEDRTNDGGQCLPSRLLKVSAGFAVIYGQTKIGEYRVACDYCETVLSL